VGHKLPGGKGLRERWHSKDLWKGENQNPHASKTEACGARRFSAIKDLAPASPILSAESAEVGHPRGLARKLLRQNPYVSCALLDSERVAIKEATNTIRCGSVDVFRLHILQDFA